MMRLHLLVLGAVLSAASFGVGSSGYITYMDLYAQKQSQWCWAGITETISKVVGTQKSQCKMASRFIKGQAGEYCCDAAKGGTAECNQPYYLDRSLGQYGYLDKVFGSQLATSQIITDLNKRLPVGVRIGWDGGGGHFLVIYGASIQVGITPAPIHTISLWNPLPIGKGDKQVLARTAVTRYQNAGNWTHSYTSKKP